MEMSTKSILSENSSINGENCCFCTEFEIGTMPAEFQSKSQIARRTIAETGEFIAIPSVSPLRMGHLLTLPKRHITSALQFDHKSRLEFINFTSELSKDVSKSLGPTIFFEHGVAPGSGGGCGVDHAHWHILPCSEDEFNSLVNEVEFDFPALSWTTFEHLNSDKYDRHSYLLLGQTCEKIAFSTASVIPSQYLRQKIASIFGLDQWNWREHSHWEDFDETYQTLTNLHQRKSAA